MKMTMEDSSQEVLEFDSNTSGWMSTMQSGEDPTMHIAQTGDTNDAFLGRPVKIATIPWAVGQELHQTFDPWSLFFENTKVINRIAHFKNLRATLNVKFQLNGSPFYYGRLMASYNPLPNSDDYTTVRPGVPADRIAASQRPKVFLDPTLNQGGELVCPFIYPKNTIDIPSGEWDKMGNITLLTLNGLQHANDNTDPITITVFAYCSQYDLSTPTSQLPARIRPQMADEYGIVSGPAHTLANWSGKLSKAPYIGKYARATQIASDAVGGIASLFGFSKPREIEAKRHVVCGDVELAVTNVPDNSTSLALDAKKEATIDPTVVGASSTDEMALIPLACKESYLTSFTWDASQASDTHLFSARVRPTQGTEVDTDNLLGEIHMTPSSWVAMPFEFWTGSMEFRFQIVCSAYHRGRLRFVWDPDHYTGNDYNVNYSQIIDISNVRDSKIKVGWGANTSYLPVAPPIESGGEQTLFPSFSKFPYTTNEDFANGTLSVYVVNELTSPSESGEMIEVNVFTNASDDFEVNSPSCNYVRLFAASDDNDYNPDPSNPRNPGGNPPPDTGPVNAPGPDGNFPIGDGDVVIKSVNPFAVLHPQTVTPGQARPFQVPQYSNQIGVATDRAYLVNGASNYLLYGRGSDVPFVSTFVFENPSSSPRPISIQTPGGPVISGTLPGFIGGTLSLDVPVVLLDPANDWTSQELNILVDGTAGRVILQRVSTSLFTNEDVVQFPLSEILLTSPDFLPDGSVLRNDITIDRQGRVNAPVTVVEGAPFSWVATESATLQGVLYENTGVSLTNAVPMPGFWSSFSGQVQANAVTEVGDPGIDIVDFYTVSNIVPEMSLCDPPITPEMDGVEEEEHEEVNAPEIETPTMYMGPAAVAGPSNQVYFGEQVSSWRQILKRSTGIYTCTGNGTGGGPASFVIPAYPTFVGDLVTPTMTAEDTGFNIYRWVSSAYVCERGGYRVKLLAGTGGGGGSQISAAFATRIPLTNTQVPSVTKTFDMDISHCGSAHSFPNLNGHFEVEVPWYSNYRFQPARSQTIEDKENFVQRQQVKLQFGHSTFARATICYSSAEDYFLANFLSVPIFIFLNE